MKWLYRIIARMCGCRHKWIIINKTDLYDPAHSMEIPVGFRYALQCSKCGDVKFKRTP